MVRPKGLLSDLERTFVELLRLNITALLQAHPTQAVDKLGNVGMVRSQCRLSELNGTFVKLFGLVVLALLEMLFGQLVKSGWLGIGISSLVRLVTTGESG